MEEIKSIGYIVWLFFLVRQNLYGRNETIGYCLVIYTGKYKDNSQNNLLSLVY